MSTIRDLITPPPQKFDWNDVRRHLMSIYNALDGLSGMKISTHLANSNFDVLSAQGLNPTTQADGDNFEFIKDWFVVGATVATYTLTPTVYPHNSTIVTSSQHFFNANVTTYSGNGLYVYQRQMGTVRQFQNSDLTLTVEATNHQSYAITVLFELYSFYDPGTDSQTGSAIYLQPGYNKISSTLQTDSLNGKTVGPNNYSEFRLKFKTLKAGTANVDFSLIKSEFGKISTAEHGSN